MPINVDEFYVTLISNSSTNLYPSNTLSAFTNQLADRKNLDEQWCVGISEIALVPFTEPKQTEENTTSKSTSLLAAKKPRIVRSVKDPPKNVKAKEQVGKTTPINTRKTVAAPTTTATTAKTIPASTNTTAVTKNDTKKPVEQQITITIDDTYKIVLRKSDLQNYATKDDRLINLTKNDINMSSILMNCVEPKIVSEDHLKNVKALIKAAVFYLLDYHTHVWLRKDVLSYTPTTDEYKLQFNLDTDTPYIVVLKYNQYSNVAYFLKDLILQVPLDKRDPNHLYKLFDYFFPEHKFVHDPHTAAGSDGDNMVALNLFHDTAKEEADGIKQFVKKTAEEQTKALQTTVENRSNALQKLVIDKAQAVVDLSKSFHHHAVLHMVESMKNRRTEVTNHINVQNTKMKDYINETMEQVAKDSITPVLHILNKRQASLPPTTHSSVFIYVYCDIIKSRLVGGQQARCLRIIPPTTPLNKEFSHIEYYPLEQTNFDNISIMIADQYGSRIDFTPSIVPVCVTLHFKRKQNV